MAWKYKLKNVNFHKKIINPLLACVKLSLAYGIKQMAQRIRNTESISSVTIILIRTLAII